VRQGLRDLLEGEIDIQIHVSDSSSTMRGTFEVRKKTMIRSDMQQRFVVLDPHRRRLCFYASENAQARRERPLLEIEVEGLVDWDGSGYLNTYDHAFAFRATSASGGELYQVEDMLSYLPWTNP
jgi:hypothetical protein